MTTWPPRFSTAGYAMKIILQQRKDDRLEDRVHCVLVVSEEEVCATENRAKACELMDEMTRVGVEVIIDKGNIKSHKKLIPTLERYPDNAILIVDDDNAQTDGWLRTFVKDHDEHPNDIIYGQGNSHVYYEGGKIIESRDISFFFENHCGLLTTDVKPASGAAGTLYPEHTFTDSRFFDREIFMRLSPTSDETWQWAFAKIAGKTFRGLSACNTPCLMGANQKCALGKINEPRYTEIHNAIAAEIPEYLEALKKEAAQ